MYNLIGLSHISADCGERAEAAEHFMVLVHNGPLMCFLSHKVQPAPHSHSRHFFAFLPSAVLKTSHFRGDLKQLFCLNLRFVAWLHVKTPEFWR